MARERGKSSRSSSVPEWWLREAGALLACGLSLYLFVSLWSSRLTGQVGSHIAGPLREFFGLTAYLVPVAELAVAINTMRSVDHAGRLRIVLIATASPATGTRYA